MFIFHKARSPTQTLNALDEYLRTVKDEPVKWIARTVSGWGNEFSYDELAAVIQSGQFDELIDWQARWAQVVNDSLAPQWISAIAAASAKATKGKTILSDSDWYVQSWIQNRGGELITQLSEESRRAVMNIILRGQGLSMAPRDVAKQVRPLIGLTARQAAANVNYRDKVYQQFIDNGLSHAAATAKAEAAALKYAGKQHRYRAETIVLTENAFAYNRGAHMGVSQSIANGLMGRCEMVWTTAGTNRVCSRCLALKDTVVGHTDESGVTIPPLHPRCRCAIMYREVEAPRVMQPRGLAAGNIESTAIEGTSPKLIDKLKDMLPATIQKTLEYYEAKIVNAPIENGIIITTIGEVYHCTGNLNNLTSIEELGEKLRGAYVTHNHPVGSDNEYSFSFKDRLLFENYNLTKLRGIDERFFYELNRNPNDVDDEEGTPLDEGYLAHLVNIERARFFGYGYRRWSHGQYGRT